MATLTGAALLLAACASPSSSAGADAVGGSCRATREWEEARGFSAAALKAGDFTLRGFVRRALTPASTLVVYIEGDGAPWPTLFAPPRDPTPLQPVALAMAAADPAASVAYLGRPCQYLDPVALAHCAPAYWSERRFAPEVVAALDAAVSQLKAESGAVRLQLVGYSGGGVLAVLLARQRDDVGLLITVAAPLVLADWVALHELSPLSGSLDPSVVGCASGTSDAMRPAQHFVGDDDKLVPPALVERYVASCGGRLQRIAGFDHERHWARDWARLLQRAREEERP